MGIRSEHDVRESVDESVETVVDFGIGDVVGNMSSGEVRKLNSGARDDGGDNDKRGSKSIRAGR